MKRSVKTSLALGALLVLPLAMRRMVPKDFSTLNGVGGANGVTIQTQDSSPKSPETPAQRDARMKWWREAKFGLFIHWGVYAVPAGKYGEKTTYGEWIMHSAKIPVAEYRKYAGQFNPVKYDPVRWVQIAKDAGMLYMVITAKHHDGFALFPSAASGWNVAEATPYKKDLLAPLVEAAHRQGLKIGFYYSQAQDWNNPGGAKSGFQEGDGWDPAHKGDFDAYLQKVAAPQVRELLTRYPIDILWWDTPTWMNPKRSTPLAALTALRPGIITNNRLGAGYGGDTATPEQFVPVTGIRGDWETCMTMNDHWGFNAADQNWKSAADLIRKLADICSKGGNFLLNVGPTAEGEIPAASVERLAEMGRWLSVNGESIYDTSAGPFYHLSWGVATQKGDRLFLHVFDWPKNGQLRVPLQNKAISAYLLASPNRPLKVTSESERINIGLPSAPVDPVDSVIVLKISGTPSVMPMPTAGKTVTASSFQEQDMPANVLDGTPTRIWQAAADQKSGWLEIDLGSPITIAGFAFDEPDVWPRLRQGVRLEMMEGGQWKALASVKTVGHGHSANIAPVKARRFRLAVEREGGAPGIAEWRLYRPE